MSSFRSLYTWKNLLTFLTVLALCAGTVVRSDARDETDTPNILFIPVDDLNDWIGCMDGHPQALTPNIDRLASRGVLFTNAHSQSPVCNPSRASFMSGLYPETTGVYFLNPPLAESEIGAKSEVMPVRFEREGYAVAAAGKIFHDFEETDRYFSNYIGGFEWFGPFPDEKISSFPGHPLWDWGAYPERDDQMPDYKIASWAEEQLALEREQPFFLALGLLTPHVPQFAPQKWLDMYPIEEVRLPAVLENDLDDISEYAKNLTSLHHVAPTHEWVVEHDQWKPLVQTYLACTTFTDHQIGRVLDALDAGGQADNTIVVLFSDHGFHLGQKEHWAKRTIWWNGAGVPLIMAGPGIVQGAVCDKPVELIDLYPTLLDLAGLEADPMHEGQSLRPLLEDPETEWPHLARSSFGPGNVALISEDYRYIHYNDGSEELYDRKNDPHEWHNIAADSAMESVLEEFRAQMPAYYHPILGQGSTGHRAYEAAEQRKE